jgi:hypothetical protein
MPSITDRLIAWSDFCPQVFLAGKVENTILEHKLVVKTLCTQNGNHGGVPKGPFAVVRVRSYNTDTG